MSNLRLKSLLFIILAFTSSSIIPQINDGVKLENIMAVYIYNFTKFIEWPQNNSDNFYISVWGKSKIIASLNSIAEKEKVNGKKIIVNEVMDRDNLKNCNILFVPSEDENRLFEAVKKVKGKKVLLITNSEGFAEKGAGINFSQSGGKIVFEINLKTLEENGIITNSRLLSIANKVYE